MKFSEQWLREWVNPGVSTEQLAHQLTMAGLEVDAIEPVAADFSGVVIGEVLKVEPHPDADKLRVCEVNVGAAEPLIIVCGAANVRPGLRIPAALIGAKLPGDFKIKKSKLRGVPSFGMLCSATEIGLAESADGLLELPVDSPVGEDIRDYFGLDDRTIELGLTPNRGDCLSLAGIAREVGVLNRCAVTLPDCSEVAATIEDTVAVTLEASTGCPRYVGRVIRGIDNRAETPVWMVERLRRSGIRALTPVVDVTNYILLELGQPMHGFDLSRLSEGITIRLANQGETVTLLNESEVELDSDVLVIADAAGVQAMAGVMGGNGCAVDEASTDIFLESAFFAPEAVAGRARRFGLHTDSSHRFERGVDPALQRRAMERATRLLLDIVGGEAGPVIELQGEQPLSPAPITLRAARIERLLGLVVDTAQVTEILQRLAMQVTEGEGSWQVIPPTFRFDVTREEDLIEEVGRIVGYDQLPSRPPRGDLQIQPRDESQQPVRRLKQQLVDRGYQEAITYSFVDPKLQAALDPEREAIPLANPISNDLSVMRTSLWPGLIGALSYNLNRQQSRIRLFESGLRFIRQEVDIEQKPMIAGVAFGGLHPEQWGAVERPIDFFDLKGDVEALLTLGGPLSDYHFRSEGHPALHPGRSARIYRGEQPVGWIGGLHPAQEKGLGLPGGIYLFELDLSVIVGGNVPKFSEISKFPAIRRDIALVVGRSVAASDIIDCILKGAPEGLSNLKLFDVYEGEHIDSGRKSVAFGLTLQAQSRTLTDDEVDTTISGIIARLGTDLGATLRE